MSQQRIIEKIAGQFKMEKYSVIHQIQLSKDYPDFVLNIEEYYDYKKKEKQGQSNKEFINLELNWAVQTEELKFKSIVGICELYYSLYQKQDKFTHGNIQPRNLVFNCGKVLLTNFGNEFTDRKNFIRTLIENEQQNLYPYLTKELLRICQKQSIEELNARSLETKQNADKEALAFIILEILFPLDFQILKSQISLEKVYNDRDKIISKIKQITKSKFPFLAKNPQTLTRIKNFLRDHFKDYLRYDQNENEDENDFQQNDQQGARQTSDDVSHLALPFLKDEPSTPISNPGINTKNRPILVDFGDFQSNEAFGQTHTTLRSTISQFQQFNNQLLIKEQEKIEQQEQNQEEQQIVQQQETQQIAGQKADLSRQDTNFPYQTQNEMLNPLQVIQTEQVQQNEQDTQQQQQETYPNQDQTNLNIQEDENQQLLGQQNEQQQQQGQQNENQQQQVLPNENQQQQPQQQQGLNLNLIDEPQSTNAVLKIFQQRQAILKGTYKVGDFQNSQNCRLLGDLIIKGSFQNNDFTLNLEFGNILMFRELKENDTKNKYIEVYERVKTEQKNYREPLSIDEQSTYKKYKVIEREKLIEFQLCFLYYGIIQKGVPNGNGKMQNYEKKYIYDGGWVNGKRQGQGTLNILNEQFYRQGCKWRYEGQFQNDKFHGRGKLYFKDDLSIYEEGDFENHKQVGFHRRVKRIDHNQDLSCQVLYINLCCQIGRFRIPFKLNCYENF